MREFRKETGRNARPEVWRIGIDPKDSTTYIVRWGLLDGAMQETSDTPGPCGNEDHSDYQSAEEYAKFCVDREIRKKKEQGYVEYVDGKATEKAATSVDFNKPLPKNLCFYKPKKKISDKNLKKLEDKSRVVWTLKRDGMMHIVVKRNGEIEIYSRRMDLVTEKFPHIVESIKKLELPNNTILLGEMCLIKDNGSDDFEGVSRICRSDPDLSLAYQGLGDFPKRKKGEKILGKICYYVFDIAFYDGQDLIGTQPTRNRLTLIKSLFRRIDKRLRVKTGLASDGDEMMRESTLREAMLRIHSLGPVKIYCTTTGDDLELAKKLAAEGFVALDADMCYGDKAYSFDGKAQRPDGIWKRKPKYEDEFVITSIYEGTGRNRSKLGGFTLKQVHPKTEEWIDCGKCGGGFSDAQREEFWAEGDDLIDKTIKVEFDSRQPLKNGVYALRFPVFKGFADKAPEECIAQGKIE